MSRQLFSPLLVFCAIFIVAPLSASATNLAVTMSWSPVGNPGNAADPLTHYGAVPYSYNIGTYDVTNSQYVAFLNSNDPHGSDPLGLYNSGMSNATYGGLSFNSGAAVGSMYSVISGKGNNPVNWVTWYDAIRFANWIDNAQTVYSSEPTSTNNATENGSYTLDGFEPTPSNASSIVRNSNAKIFLPSENEWYKAAHYNPATRSYFIYGTSSNARPNAIGPTSTPNSANCLSVVGNLTAVGAYSGTTSPYGAFDMLGDVSQWNEPLLDGVYRGYNGDNFHDGSTFDLTSSASGATQPTLETDDIGFRLASVPEPSTLALAALAGMGLIGLVWRRRRIA